MKTISCEMMTSLRSLRREVPPIQLRTQNSSKKISRASRTPGISRVHIMQTQCPQREPDRMWYKLRWCSKRLRLLLNNQRVRWSLRIKRYRSSWSMKSKAIFKRGFFKKIRSLTSQRHKLATYAPSMWLLRYLNVKGFLRSGLTIVESMMKVVNSSLNSY